MWLTTVQCPCPDISPSWLWAKGLNIGFVKIVADAVLVPDIGTLILWDLVQIFKPEPNFEIG